MVIRHYDRNAQVLGVSNPIDAGDAVVDCDNDRRIEAKTHIHNFRRQPVTVLETVRHEVLDLSAQLPKNTDHQCGAGCPVAIEVANNENPLPGIQGPTQHLDGSPDALEVSGRQESLKGQIQVLRAGYTPTQIKALKKAGQAACQLDVGDLTPDKSLGQGRSW